MDNFYQLKLTSGMTKARLCDTLSNFKPLESATALRGDRFCFSLLITAAVPHEAVRTDVRINSPLAPYINAYKVEHVPVRLPHFLDKYDEDYLGHEPGLYPDLLCKFDHVYVTNRPTQLYFEVNLPEALSPAAYPIEISLTSGDKCPNHTASVSLSLEVLDAVLPKLDIPVTQWFHYDCLADYYGVEIFSERHWELIESYMTAYVESGMNTLLTPIFTPPLDTDIGGERPTVQLVDITVTDGKYTFGFDKLARFCALCKRVGIETLEIAHLFTQWGAAHAPKIVATENGVCRRIFGWETDAAGEDYVAFLHAFLPVLKEKLDEFGYKDRYFFHLSDEPSEAHLTSYNKAKNAVWHLVSDHPVRDALGNFALYKKGVVKAPIVANNRIEEFHKNGIENLWVYYCCSQGVGVSNRFIAMPGYRTRILGAQMYKANAAGFLQWGYNFYYAVKSRYLINPFLCTDTDCQFPAGDAFAVYPGADGKPMPSLHEVIFEQALFDLRALRLAEQRVGRERVLRVLKAAGTLDYENYPKNEDFLLKMREEINRLAAE